MTQSISQRFCLALLLFFTIPPSAQAQQAIPTFGAWLQSFYESRTAPQGESVPGTDPFRNLLSAEMRQLYEETRPTSTDAASQDAADALTRALIYGPGARPGAAITLIEVTERPWWYSFGNSARVTLSIDGVKQILIVKGYFDRVACRWFVIDIEYGSGRTLRRELI
ncbi:hypothetical protein [Dongia sp.]|uniref:hypothetical protein n=1 Tax=Dongia sp. TaxID=1977262 RepID=UPI0035B4A29C